MKILVTGTAGFIGAATSVALLEGGHTVVGIDNMNTYYDASLKTARLKRCEAYPAFRFERCDLADAAAIALLFERHQFDAVIHLAAQAGVRYSLENPSAYIQSNLVGFGHVLEGCRQHHVGHLVFASSSSVYGANATVPFAETASVDHPLSLYAATKKSNELMAHSYAHLFKLPCTGLRFFTVYGPWGRPDMALLTFTKLIDEGKPIMVYNHGQMIRDFTYVDDIVDVLLKVVHKKATPKSPTIPFSPAVSDAPYRIYNVGHSTPVALEDCIAFIEDALGKKAIRQYAPLQPGDMLATHADVSSLITDFDYKPRTTLQDGIHAFVNWYKQYY